ncbi:hypothetical protein B0H16DRAFT_1692335 [Mycena metata]|uniref:Transmembrane protein n=1 Tax=Mycena metata TaxID=1033252 RepID=A0AAD7N6T4_9AGAR|nr:hypothetical protein B0H16DRAFT_1692335 [Mycena metata]
MWSFKGVLKQLTSYRLGYTPTHPYPWKWATPAILVVFLLISVFLGLVNIPLSAYDIVQESTYRPNDTLRPLLLSNMLPGILRTSAPTFAPHILTVGEPLVVNNSVFNYTIAGAFDGNSSPVSSFSYSNNPFSEGCDISAMTINLEFVNLTGSTDINFEWSVDVACRIPLLFQLSSTTSRFLVGNLPREVLNGLVIDLREVFTFWPPQVRPFSQLSVSTVPCCDCGDGPSGSPTSLQPTELPCSAQPSRLNVTDVSVNGESVAWVPVPLTSMFGSIANGIVSQFFTGISPSGFNEIFQNIFQAIYHLARLELGIITENQIFNSPTMFNDTISDLYFPLPGLPPDLIPVANDLRISTSNETLMAQWAEVVHFFNTTDRVPVVEYLRSIPRLKPLGSAVTAVFTSTFAMVSVLWTVFSIIAGAIAARSVQTDINDRHSVETSHSEMELALRRIQIALKKRGLLEDDELEPVFPSTATSTAAELVTSYGGGASETFKVEYEELSFELPRRPKLLPCRNPAKSRHGIGAASAVGTRR